MSDFSPTQDDLVAYLRGQLTAAESGAIDARLARDERLRDLLERTREVLRIVTESTEDSTVRRANDYLRRGIEAGASDVHLDLERDGGVVRLRIDGALHEVDRLPIAAARAVLARFKTLFAMPPENTDLPADGRLAFGHGEKRLDLRGSFLPGIHGGRLCARILDQTTALAPWDKLGLFPEEEAALQRLARLPHGMVTVTGPTGSGKTTLLYALVRLLAGEAINCVSVEDPVEFDLPWVAQSSVNPARGVTFAYLLRAVLRQDPDVIMVGEIRDLESLQMLVQCAITGHLALTTLHTYNAVATISRLLDVGLEPFLVSSSLRGIVGMRLVRKVCPECAEEVRAPLAASVAEALGIADRGIPWRRGRGCTACHQSGFRGRTGVYEIVEVSSALADAIAAREPEPTLRELAFTGTLPTMQGHAARLVIDGVTTPDEAARVLGITW
ncbi:MAG: type II/IV secretion system protein [Armatimonadetes bacterium]|nr:type II/IV secretion system protein [Armatimonadota bacterium]